VLLEEPPRGISHLVNLQQMTEEVLRAGLLGPVVVAPFLYKGSQFLDEVVLPRRTRVSVIHDT
jgi:hypothetical protein